MVTNLGDDLGSAVLNDFFPKSMTIVAVRSAKPVSHCILSEGHVSCIVEAFFSGPTGSLTIVARSNKAGSVTNTARLDQADRDSNRDNNKDSVTVTVIGATPTPSPTPFPSGAPQTGVGGSVPRQPLMPLVFSVLAVVLLTTSWTLRRRARPAGAR
jgi:hypothetical protein